jgi:hypothetical protein
MWALFDEIWDLTILGPGTLQEYQRVVRLFLSIRMTAVGGANPIERMLGNPHVALEALAMQLPYVSIGSNYYVTRGMASDDGDGMLANLFVKQFHTHWRSVLRQVIFGSKPCGVRNECLLPKRPACGALTDLLAHPKDRGPTEAAIAHILQPFCQ